MLTAAVLMLALPASAQAFNPAFQSHRGACSQDTENAGQALRDLQANGVLGTYAGAVGVHASDQSLARAMRRWIVIGLVARVTVTDNHGCDGNGAIFGVGPRTLFVGEPVGVKVPATLRTRVCARPAAGCVAVTTIAHVVFPTNCWNLNTGTIAVTVYVHPKPKPKRKVSDPSARAVLSCAAGGFVVTLSNGRKATAPASFTVNGISYGPVAPGASRAVTIVIAAGGSTVLTVSSGHRTLIAKRALSNTCTTPATPAASASAVVSCSAGGVVVTLSNAVSATAPASFTVNGTAYGPVAPGASQTATVPLAPGATVNVTVTSGNRVLIGNQSFTSTCAAIPAATASLTCTAVLGGGSVAVALSNGAAATLPASFTVSATGNASGGFGPASYGPLAPGATQMVTIPVDASGTNVVLTVTSGGTTILTMTYAGGCPGLTA